MYKKDFLTKREHGKEILQTFRHINDQFGVDHEVQRERGHLPADGQDGGFTYLLEQEIFNNF